IRKADDMIGVQVREEDSLHILPPHLELRQALQRAAPGVEKEFLLSGFYQGARSKAMHDRRWTPGAQEGHRDRLALRSGWDRSGDKEYNSEHSTNDGRNHITPPSFEGER